MYLPQIFESFSDFFQLSVFHLSTDRELDYLLWKSLGISYNCSFHVIHALNHQRTVYMGNILVPSSIALTELYFGVRSSAYIKTNNKEI